MKKICSVLFCILFFSSCATDEVKKELSAEDLYNIAFEDLQKTRYKKAAQGFEQLEVEHPYSKWAVKAKLMSAYAYYKDESYDDAVLALDRFIKYHPGNKDVAYAYYLKGMCYYSQISSAEKDQGDTRYAEEVFERLIALYPNSKYAEDARKKLNLTEDYKAGQEMVIGRFYLNNGNYLSALNRFNVVLENFQTTVQIEEALYRQVEIYKILGLDRYAKGYYDILQLNYPKGKWTKKAKNVLEIKKNNEVDIDNESKKSWITKLKFWEDFNDENPENKDNIVNNADNEGLTNNEMLDDKNPVDEIRESSWWQKLKFWSSKDIDSVTGEVVDKNSSVVSNPAKGQM